MKTIACRRNRNFDVRKIVCVDGSVFRDDIGFVCPISKELFVDPVTVKGYVFERESITKWFRESEIHPITRHRIPWKYRCEMETNFTMKSNVNSYRLRISEICYSYVEIIMKHHAFQKPLFNRPNVSISGESTELVLDLLTRAIKISPDERLKAGIICEALIFLRRFSELPELQKRQQRLREIEKKVLHFLEKQKDHKTVLSYLQIVIKEEKPCDCSMKYIEKYLAYEKDIMGRSPDPNLTKKLIDFLYLKKSPKLKKWIRALDWKDHTITTLLMIKVMKKCLPFSSEYHTLLCQKYFDENQYEKCFEELVYTIDNVYRKEKVKTLTLQTDTTKEEKKTWKKKGFRYSDSIMIPKIKSFLPKFLKLERDGVPSSAHFVTKLYEFLFLLYKKVENYRLAVITLKKLMVRKKRKHGKYVDLVRDVNRLVDLKIKMKVKKRVEKEVEKRVSRILEDRFLEMKMKLETDFRQEMFQFVMNLRN